MRINPWIMIFVGGLFEAVWATTMNMSDGFTDLFWTPVTFGISLISVWFLYQGFRMGLPVGSSYAAWTGCGTVLSTVFGLVFYDQLLSGLQNGFGPFQVINVKLAYCVMSGLSFL